MAEPRRIRQGDVNAVLSAMARGETWDNLVFRNCGDSDFVREAIRILGKQLAKKSARNISRQSRVSRYTRPSTFKLRSINGGLVERTPPRGALRLVANDNAEKELQGA